MGSYHTDREGDLLRKSTFNHIDSEIYAFHDTVKEIVKLKHEILHASPSHENTGGGRSNLPSDPTGTIATLLVTHRAIEQMERTVEAIEFIYNGLPEEKKRLMRIRYWARPQTLTWDGIALEINVSRRQAINWRDEIVRAIAYRIGYL